MSLLFRKPDRTRMLTDAPWKAALAFVLPLMISSVLQNTYGVVDSILVGHYNGEGALAAVGSVSVLIALLQCTASGFAFGINAVLSRYNGANDTEGYRNSFRVASLLTFLAGIVVITFGVLAGEFIMNFVMNIPDEIMGLARSYYYVSLVSVFFAFIYNTQGAVLRSMGNSSYLLYSLLCTSFLNIVLDVLFISVLGWGVTGAAVATAISSFVAILIISYLKKRGYSDLSMKSVKFRLEKRYVNEIAAAALPMVAQQLIIFSSYVIYQNPINGYGVNMTAAFTVERSIEIITRIPMTAFGSAMLTFVGLAYGARNRDKLFTGVRQIWMMSMGITASVGILVAILSPYIVGFYPIEGTSFDYAVDFLRTIAFTLPLFTAYYAIHGFFQGVKKPIVCTVITFTELIVRAVILYTMDPVFGHEVVWYSVPIAWSFALVCSAIMFVRYRKAVYAELSQENAKVPAA